MAKLPTDIKALARVHTESALRVLSSIMNCDDAPHNARATAAIALLDRGWGKPQQAIEVSGEISSNVVRAPAVVIGGDDWQKQHVPQNIRPTEH